MKIDRFRKDFRKVNSFVERTLSEEMLGCLGACFWLGSFDTTNKLLLTLCERVSSKYHSTCNSNTLEQKTQEALFFIF